MTMRVKGNRDDLCDGPDVAAKGFAELSGEPEVAGFSKGKLAADPSFVLARPWPFVLTGIIRGVPCGSHVP